MIATMILICACIFLLTVFTISALKVINSRIDSICKAVRYVHDKVEEVKNIAGK